jgi:uncharacterized protein
MMTLTEVIHSIGLRQRLRLGLLGLVLVVSGCGLSRGAPPQQFYVLGAQAPATSSEPPFADSPTVVVGLRQPLLAEYLSTPFIVVRSGSNRIGLSEFDRWGEDLSRALNRVLAASMAARMPSARVVSVPWPGGTQPDFVIQYQLQRFEGVAPEGSGATVGEAHLLATWEVLGRADGVPLGRGTTEVREGGWTVGDFHALVRLLDAGLVTLADDLIRALEGLPRPLPVPEGERPPAR